MQDVMQYLREMLRLEQSLEVEKVKFAEQHDFTLQ
jgi:hypothetical protein